ncbi:MAG TPA: zinc-binding dehydrogenase, partial [Micropruina sp.]|nr:zinc-binding dehydrogenase [Micropruina sp.]
PGATVLIHGATGVSGLLAVQVAKTLGAGQVVAAGRSRSGLARAKDRGADALLALDEPLAPQLEQAAPDGVDLVVDYLWGERTRNLLVALLTTERKPDSVLELIEVGSMVGPWMPLDAAWLRSRPLRISGSGLGSVGAEAMFRAVGGVLQAAAEGRLSIDFVTRPLSEVQDAWAMKERLVLIP